MILYYTGISILFPAILSLIIPRVAAKSVKSVITVRAFMGLFSAACFPSSFHLFPFWVPPEEKSVLIPLFYLGMYLGEILGFSIGGGFLGHLGWEPIFYFFGAVGIAWFPMWLYMAYETPQIHPKISAAELQIFENASRQNMSSMSMRFDSTASKDSSSISPTEGTSSSERPTTPRVSSIHKALLSASSKAKSIDTMENQDDQPAPRLSAASNSSASQKERNASFHPMTGASEQVLVRIDEVNSMQASTRAQARKTPWLAFFTHPSSLTLLLASWTHVRVIYFTCSTINYTML